MNNNIKILSCVGGHPVNIYKNAEFDSAIRKYRGGEIAATIPYAGFMLSARAEQVDDEPIIVDGVEIPTKTPQKWVSVDPLPDEPDALYIVSAMYVAARKELGLPTNMLLTIGQVVVDETGRVAGCVNLNRN